jgi:lipopolysaccharide/colanic/teichoic acid biosynthesis glycosyltransferase
MFLIDIFRRSAHHEQLLSPGEVQRALDDERNRVDRNGSQFAVIVFSCGGSEPPRQMAHIASTFGNRLRSTDRAGFLVRSQLIALLPDTGGAGARKVAEDLSQSIGEGLSPNVFVYPTDSLPASHDGDSVNSPTVTQPIDHLFLRPLPFWKRCLDLFGACMALVVTSPLMLAAGVAIKATSQGPILFTQQRCGLGGRRFTIYKFRTMRVGAEEMKSHLRAQSEQDGPAFKIKDDPRVTAVGRFLRRSCIDEFPQFWNVLCGDMSLVGPRPLPCEESEQCERWQRRRLLVTPGLTCTWQVSGGMRIPFVEWMRMDIRYIRSRKFANDVRLLCRTFVAVLFQRASH